MQKLVKANANERSSQVQFRILVPGATGVCLFSTESDAFLATL
jgi:hypothetical protein